MIGRPIRCLGTDGSGPIMRRKDLFLVCFYSVVVRSLLFGMLGCFCLDSPVKHFPVFLPPARPKAEN